MIRNVYSGTRIQNPGSFSSWIPDPKAQKALDTGSRNCITNTDVKVMVSFKCKTTYKVQVTLEDVA
jgi:hypothetical protein